MNTIRLYFFSLIVLVISIAKAQSKDCNIIYYNVGPTIRCTILPSKTINDTVMCIIPKDCNNIRFDSIANGYWKVLSFDTITLIETINFKNGIKHGLNIHYFDNKNIRVIQNYLNGKLRGEEIIYNELGQITQKGIYDEKESFSGIVKQYWDNGKLASIEHWEKGWYNGEIKYWNNTGKIINEKTFEKLWYDCK